MRHLAVTSEHVTHVAPIFHNFGKPFRPGIVFAGQFFPERALVSQVLAAAINDAKVGDDTAAVHRLEDGGKAGALAQYCRIVKGHIAGQLVFLSLEKSVDQRSAITCQTGKFE